MSARISVVIADDHPATRVGVRQVLEEDRGFDLVAEVGDGHEAVRAALEHEPDVCLLDVHMPGGGVDTAAAIIDRLPSTAVVMLTVSDADDDLLAALRAGASGYLLKGMDPGRLPSALRGVLAGEAALPRVLVTRVLEELRGRGERRLVLPGSRTVLLSEREWEVLELLRLGSSTAEIAAALFLSPVTVRRHISSAVAKLGVRDREDALALLSEHSA